MSDCTHQRLSLKAEKEYPESPYWWVDEVAVCVECGERIHRASYNFGKRVLNLFIPKGVYDE